MKIQRKLDIDDPLTYKIIGCAMNVHNELGNGFQEVVYQRSLEIEFNINKIEFQRELEMPIFYKDYEVGTRRVDFLVENTVLVERFMTIPNILIQTSL